VMGTCLMDSNVKSSAGAVFQDEVFDPASIIDIYVHHD
jgi:hypothetical protein